MSSNLNTDYKSFFIFNVFKQRIQFKALPLYIRAEIKPTPVRTCDLGELTLYQQLYCYLKILTETDVPISTFITNQKLFYTYEGTV